MKPFLPFFSSILIVVVLASCSVEKRHYMQGYSVHVKKETTRGNGSTNFLKQYSKAEEDTNQHTAITAAPDLLASAGIGNLIIPQNTPSLFEQKNSNSNKQLQRTEECDLIKLKNGKEIKGKVVEVSPNIIKYTNCNDESGQLITIVKADVAMIAYNNGTKDNFTNAPRGEDNRLTDDVVNRKTRKYAKLSVLFGILSFIPAYGVVLGIFAITFGASSLRKFNKYPLEEQVKKRALIGLWLGISGLIVSAVVLMLLIASIFALV